MGSLTGPPRIQEVDKDFIDLVSDKLQNTPLPVSKRSAVLNGYGAALGLTNTRNGPVLNSLTEYFSYILRDIWVYVRTSPETQGLVYSSIQANWGTTMIEHVDENNRGPSLII